MDYKYKHELFSEVYVTKPFNRSLWELKWAGSVDHHCVIRLIKLSVMYPAVFAVWERNMWSMKVSICIYFVNNIKELNRKKKKYLMQWKQNYFN